MPRYTFLEIDLRCPNCAHQVTDLMWYGWGYSSAQQPVRGDDQEPSNTYFIGDTVRWKSCVDGNIPAWASFGNQYDRLNIGDPNVLDLTVLDLFLGQPDAVGNPSRCSNCQSLIGGGAIEIRGGIVCKAWIFAPGEFDTEVEYYTARSDGSLKPRYDWTNTHPLYNQLNQTPLWTRVPQDC